MQTTHEVILDWFILSGNNNQVGYPLAYKALESSWYEIFKKTKESVVRKWIPIEKSALDYPKSLESLLGLYIVDSCGDLAPLYEDNAKNIVPIPPKKCSCNSCDISECMCPTIQAVPLITDVVIQGTTYQNKSITRVLKNGDVVEETETWVPSYNAAGAFVSAIKIPKQTTKCQVEVKPCGCPVNNESNSNLLFKCGCINDCDVPYMRDRYPALYNEFGYYKKDDGNKKIHVFNSEGKKSLLTQVLVVFESNGADMLVPQYAVRCLYALLNHTVKQYSPLFTDNDRVGALRNYNREKKNMIRHLNPIPNEWLVQVDDARRKNGNTPYYGRPHSDFVTQPTVSTQQICATPPATIQYITNISNTIAAAKVLKVVFDGGEIGDPSSGGSTFQNPVLIGLGGTLHRITIKVDAFDMQNYGQAASFTYNYLTGLITMLNGYIFAPLTTLEIDLNQ